MLADPLKTPAPLFKAIQDGGGLAYIDPNGEVNVDTLKPILDLWVRTGLIQIQIQAQPGFDISTLVDPRPAQQAVASMGRYS
jgi:hypothetical protein